jgi:membrane-bound lytic murein transglycosylase D
MLRLSLIAFFLWILHARAHDEPYPELIHLSHGSGMESVATDDTPVTHTEIAGAEVKAGDRPWRAPKYNDQSDLVGYSKDTFKVPHGLEKAVQFWIDVYTKYPTTQGVIHDSEYIDLIYEIVDFKEIEKNKDIGPRQKEKRKKQLVNEAKQRVSDLLRKLDSNSNSGELSAQEKRVWDYMKNIDNPKKFREANDKNRLRFQLGQSDRMKSAIYFSGRYLEDFEQIFREEKLPIELTRLVFVESSFNILARSKVGASGLWQIMPSVARPHRMISSHVDRRNDPWDATRLAAKVLAGNFKLLGDWPLAVTGYNHGPNGMRKMSEKYNTKNLVDLVENVRSKKSFGFASRNFYASFMAALEVERNAKTYFPDILWSEKLKSVPYKMASAMPFKDLTRVFDNDRGQVEIYNPHLTSRSKGVQGMIPAGTKIYVPAAKLVLLEKKGNSRKVAAENPKDFKPSGPH